MTCAQILVPDEHLPLIRTNALLAQIGGRSNFRKDRERQQALSADQLVGQLATAAASLYLADSIEPYKQARERANAHPYEGDGGRDFWLPVDVKGSLMRVSNDPLDYRLLVRPRERHPRWVYVLAMVDRVEPPITVHVVGWAWSHDLPVADTAGAFRGAHVLLAEQLRPVEKLRTVVKRHWIARQQGGLQCATG